MSTTVSPSRLAKQIFSYLVLFMSHPCLAQTETADILVGLGRFKSPFTETSFHSCRFHLLLDEVDLGREALALLVHGLIPIDLSHKTPIVGGELVEGVAESGKGGATSHQCREEPDGECTWRLVIIVVIVFSQGIKVHDEGEISWGIVGRVPRHLPSIQPLDPFCNSPRPIFAWKVEVDFSLVLFVPWGSFFEGSLRVNIVSGDTRSLEVVEGFLK